jgi:hypothetical protein
VGIPTLQRALVEDPRLAVGHGVINEQALLQVLPGIGEVETEHLDVGARCGEAGGRRDTHEVAAKADHDVLELGIAADFRLLR